MRFERLGRTIAATAALALATLLGGGVVARRRVVSRAPVARR
jgi:hypothetical protein